MSDELVQGTWIGPKPRPALTRPAVGDDVELQNAILEAKLARLNWQKYNVDQSDEVVYQAEKMAAAINRLTAALSSLPDMQEVERLRDALVKVKDRCWEADEANWQHDILSIVVPITDALKGQLTRGERND
jgi:hypothetical protein